MEIPFHIKQVNFETVRSINKQTVRDRNSQFSRTLLIQIFVRDATIIVSL